MSGGGLAWAKVLRLSLFASALADPVVGVILGATSLEPHTEIARTLGVCAAASLAVYHGAMALNDWADRKVDRENQRGRPLEQGSLKAPQVLLLALCLLVSGPAIAWLGGLNELAIGCIGAAACIAALYDLWGRGAWLGPLLLASARALNLLFGACAVGATQLTPLFAALFYGLFIFKVSRLGRMEDSEDRAPLKQRPAKLLRSLGGDMLLCPLFIGLFAWFEAGRSLEPTLFHLGIPVGLAIALRRLKLLDRYAKREHWTPAAVEACMGPALGSLVPYAICTILVAAPYPLAWLAAGSLFVAQQISRRLMRFIPPS